MICNDHYYFNTGSLDANKIVKQFIDIFIRYEMIGVKIFGIVGDGCGGNEKCFRTLVHNLPMTGLCPSKDYEYFSNYIDPSRMIYSWARGTHLVRSYGTIYIKVNLIWHVTLNILKRILDGRA